MTLLRILLAFIFILIFLIPISLAIYFGVRSRARYADRIFEAQRRGSFNDLKTWQEKNKFLSRMVVMTSGYIGLLISLILFFLYYYKVLDIPIILILVVLVISFLSLFVGGFLMQREITRRL